MSEETSPEVRQDRGRQRLKDMAHEIHERINAERIRRGLAPLRWDEATVAIAAAHSRNMADNMFFAHRDPRGRKARDRLSHLVSGCQSSWTGENIFMSDNLTGHHGLPERAVASWMASRGHRSNILRPRFDTTGIGLAVIGSRIYVTQSFLWCSGH
ncbi:MAG: CAP domain-containing protein [Bryobacterales bacterium]|nr:CAP domain-containing protein [Bryobacterales bacterium]